MIFTSEYLHSSVPMYRYVMQLSESVSDFGNIDRTHIISFDWGVNNNFLIIYYNSVEGVELIPPIMVIYGL